VRVNIGGLYGKSTGPLELAARIGDAKLVELFLSVGARPRYTKSNKKCALV
jgi:hypothetical protein